MQAQAIDIALAIGITGFSAIMLATSLFSYAKTKVVKLVPISIAFVLFMLKGIYFIYEVVNKSSLSNSIRIVLVLDFIIIIMIYFAVAKR